MQWINNGVQTIKMPTHSLVHSQWVNNQRNLGQHITKSNIVTQTLYFIFSSSMLVKISTNESKCLLNIVWMLDKPRRIASYRSHKKNMHRIFTAITKYIYFYIHIKLFIYTPPPSSSSSQLLILESSYGRSKEQLKVVVGWWWW